jgi:hypothetical protein
MSRNTRIGDSRTAAFDDDRVAVAHTARLNFDAHLSRAWLGNLQLNELKTGSSRSHLGGFHGCYCDCGGHKFSCLLFVRVADLVNLVVGIFMPAIY